MTYSKFIIASSAVAMLGFSACSGGSESGGNTSPTSSITTKTGLFLDSPVEGLSYNCISSGLHGKTNAQGEYNYKEGDTCTFSLGSIEIGTAKAQGIITPLELYPDDGDKLKFANMLRFLQTLDEDGNTSNGISLPDVDGNITGGFDVDESSFDATFQDFLDTNNINASIISSQDAENHFHQTLFNKFDTNLTDAMFEDKMFIINGLQIIMKTDKSMEIFARGADKPCSGSWSLSDDHTLFVSAASCGLFRHTTLTQAQEYQFMFENTPAQGVNLLYAYDPNNDNNISLHEVDAFTDAVVPATPADITYSDVNQTSFTIHWKNTAENETVNKVACYTNADTTTQPILQFLPGSNATNFQLTYSGLTINTLYGCRVSANNLIGTSESDMVNITTDSNTSTTTQTHSFQEGLTLDISSGIVDNATIALFKNDNASIEMLFTLTKDKTAIIQYVQDGNAIWQNTQYIYSISGNTITCNLPVGGGFNIGQEPAPAQVIATLDSSTVTAHTTATISGDAYTVFSANGDTIQSNSTSASWTATPLTAPLMDVTLSSDGETIVGIATDFSLHAYNLQTQATTDLLSDTNGNLLNCLQNSGSARDIIQVDESKTKYAFVCVNPFGDDPLGDFANDKIYTYDLTTNTYKTISKGSLDVDAYAPFINTDASKVIYQAGATIYEYDVNSETTSTVADALSLLDIDTSLNTIAYTRTQNFYNAPDYQQLVVMQNGTTTVIEDLEQDTSTSVQLIDARVSRDGTKVIYMIGNLYDSQRSSLISLYMYDFQTGTKTTLAENFFTGPQNTRHDWGMSSDASTLVFIMNTPWGSEDIEAEARIYTFNVADKTHKEIYKKDNIEGVLISPDASSIFTSDARGYLLQLSAQ